MLRYRSDWRTLGYLALTVALSIVQWRLGYVHPLLFPLSLFMAVTVAVISHNLNHVSIWNSRPLNLLTRYVVAIYYGHPTIGWVPTHNINHHKLNNGPGDRSRGPKVFERSHLLALLVYPSLTSLAQSKDIGAYIRGLWRRDRRQFYAAISEYGVFFGFMAVIFVIDWRKALLFFVIPQQFALFVIQIFNYVQHVEANHQSEWNHSRNFVSPVLNALLFNNGYHTVHHHMPGLHWSKTPEAHAKVAHNIHPELLQRSWWKYMIWTFLLRPFVPGARAPELHDVHQGPPKLETATEDRCRDLPAARRLRASLEPTRPHPRT